MSIEPLPTTEEITSQEEFEVDEIDRKAFHEIWDRANAMHFSA